MMPIQNRRVALVTSNFPPGHGGSAEVYRNLAWHAGERVVVVAPRVDYVTLRPITGCEIHDRSAPYQVVRVPLLRSRLTRATPNFVERLRLAVSELAIRVRLSAVLLYLVACKGVRTICLGELLASAWIARVIKLQPWVRLVVYVHGEEITTEADYDRSGRRRRRALGCADEIIAVSPFTETMLRKFIGSGSSKPITLIANGVDTTRFGPAPRRADLVARHGLRDCLVLVTVCRLVEKKGVDQAIRAFARICERLSDCRYIVVGDGPYAATLKELAFASGVADSVIFTGAVAADDLADFYRLGDIFVMPNRRLPDGDTEGFGLVFLEANACGLPVIAGRDGGSTAAVRDGENGLVVDGHSVDDIAAAIARLIADPELRARLAKQGLQLSAAADWRTKAGDFLRACRIPEGSARAIKAVDRHGRARSGVTNPMERAHTCQQRHS